MDIFDSVAAQAKTYVANNRDVLEAGYECIKWVHRAQPFVELAYQAYEGRVDPNEFMKNGLEAINAVREIAEDYAKQQKAGNEWVAQPDQSVELGGRGVDADISEIEKVQAEHEKEWAEQKDAMDQVRENLNKNYEGPELQEHLLEFEKVAAEENQRLAAEHTAQLLQLQEQQLQRPPIENPNLER